MRLLLLCLAVCLGSSVGQTPPGGSGAPPTNPAATKPPASPSIAPALHINPAKPANPTGSQNRGPPRASPPNARGLGIFNAPVSNPWGIPPPQQQWNRPQSYPPTSMTPGFQMGPGWGPQPPPNPFSSMPWLRMQNMQNMNVLLDRMDVPCGMSRRRQQMFVHAVDHPDPFCECRIGGCDGFVDFSGQGVCGAFAASCCCTGTPYSSLVTATLLSSNAGAGRQGPFSPFGNPMMQQNPYQRGPMGRQPQGFAPGPVPSAMRRNQAIRTQPTTAQDFQNMWFR